MSGAPRLVFLPVVGAVFLILLPAQEQTAADKPKEPSEEGIPVTHSLVVEKCGVCHKKDEKGNLSRISWERTTPEGWQQAIKRMVRLNGVDLTPEQGRVIVRYLSDHHGLAPEEARPALYVAERRMIDEPTPNESIRDACMTCHSLGRAMSWRRSREEWELLLAMHRGYFPASAASGLHRFPSPQPPNAPPPAAGTDTRPPADRAVEYLAKTYPLHSPEWSAWRAGRRAPKLAGRWLVTGVQPGRGRIFGEMVIAPTAESEFFTASAKLFYAKEGKTTTRSSRALIYTGYAWRGRSESSEAGEPKEWREVMMVSREQSQMEGRWFWGAYDEFGLDVTLRRAGSDSTVFGLSRTAFKAGATGERVEIYGNNLPADLKPEDIDFGSGVTVRQVLNPTPASVTVEVDVATAAIAGRRDVVVRGAAATAAFAVYDKIDYLKVMPEAAMARLGGATHPKGFQQFEAIAYNRGPDNKPRTPDDVNLGPVDVNWSVEEFLAVYGDDDKDFVGTLSATGLFTPAREGPNPERKFGRNNYGDVWVVATLQPKYGETGKDSKPLSGRAHLVVTIPLYVRWDQPEVAQ